MRTDRSFKLENNQLIQKGDKLMETTKKGNVVIAQDIGNITHGCATFKRATSSLSSLIAIDENDVSDMATYDDINPYLYEINGKFYLYGEIAAQKGLVDIQGNSRYASGIYDVKAAIGMFNTIEADTANVILMGSYPPKDKAYREYLKDITKGQKFVVRYNGKVKKFTVKDARFTKESKAAFFHALTDWDGIHASGEQLLRHGSTLVIDVGGFTTDLEGFNRGISMDMEASEPRGIINIINKLQDKMRKEYWKELQGIDLITHDQWVQAIETGELKIGVHEPMPCKEIVKDLINSHINYITRLAKSRFQSLKSWDCLLLVNGGGKVIEKQFRELIDHPHIYVGEQNRKNMHLCTTYGLLKQARALEAKGEI